MQQHRFITTIERGSNDALLVAIPIKGKRAITKTLRRMPTENPEAFMTRAVHWRDRAWRRIHGGTVPNRSFHMNARTSSITETPGVRLINKKVKKGERSYTVPCVIAEVHTIPGKDYQRPRGSRSKLYSLGRYELDEAIALAAAWRAEQISALENSRS